jgi:hypothetical protein
MTDKRLLYYTPRQRNRPEEREEWVGALRPIYTWAPVSHLLQPGHLPFSSSVHANADPDAWPCFRALAPPSGPRPEGAQGCRTAEVSGTIRVAHGTSTG